MANGKIVIETEIDNTESTKQLKNLEKISATAESGLKSLESATNSLNSTSESLSSKLKVLNSRYEDNKSSLAKLNAELDDSVSRYGASSKEANDLYNSINKLENEQSILENQLEATNKDIDKQDTAFRGLKTASGIASTAIGTFSKAITGAITGTVALVGALAGISASTVELREDLNKLDSAFQAQGKTVEEAREVYGEFYGLLGESDTAVEASNLLVQLTNDNKELAKWADISAGVMATFPDSLPIESLIEASNETAKVGQVTGALADALNWAGISEEQFNVQLQALATEEERVALITETLNNEYREAAELYRQNNASIIEYRKAQENLATATAELGEAFQPVLTMITQLGADLLPYVTEKVEALVNAFETGGITAFASELGDIASTIISDIAKMLPNLVKMGVEIIKSLIEGIKKNVKEIAEAAIEIFNTLALAILELLPELIELGIQLIMALIEGILESLPMLIEKWQEALFRLVDLFVENIDMFIDLAIQLILALVDGILIALPKLIEAALEVIVALAFGLIEALPVLLAKIPEIISGLVLALLAPDMILKLIDAGIQLIIALIGGLIAAIPQLLAIAPRLIIELFNGIKDSLVNTDWAQLGKDIISGMLNGLGSMGQAIWESIVNIGNSIVNGFKDFFGIHSPSHLMRDDIGKMLSQGIGVGFEDDINNVYTGMENALNTENAKLQTNVQTGSVFNTLNATQPVNLTNNNNTVLEVDGRVLAEVNNENNNNIDLQYMF